jgi:hypothetical protein
MILCSDTYVEGDSVDRQLIVVFDLPSTRLLFALCVDFVMVYSFGRFGYKGVYRYSTPSPMITFIFFIDLATPCLIAVGKTDVSTGTRYIPFSHVFFSRCFRYDVLFSSSFRVYDYSGRFGIAFV